MVELFFALMLCIIREILNIGNDNVFIETGNKNDRNRDKNDAYLCNLKLKIHFY